MGGWIFCVCWFNTFPTRSKLLKVFLLKCQAVENVLLSQILWGQKCPQISTKSVLSLGGENDFLPPSCWRSRELMICTHGQILLENLCRRRKAMVVRTIRVVHMVLPPLPKTALPLGLMVLQSTEAPSPIEKAWMVQGRVLRRNEPDYSCLPSWLSLMIGEISSED